jgi:NADH:ubiquinone oxidoreductase subunit
MANISFYGSHNATFVVEKDGKILPIIEVERFSNSKNCGIAQYKPAVHILLTLEECLKFIKNEYGIDEFDTCYYECTDVVVEDFDRRHIIYPTEKRIPAKNYKHVGHHEAHAYGCFYQSPYKEALVSIKSNLEKEIDTIKPVQAQAPSADATAGASMQQTGADLYKMAVMNTAHTKRGSLCMVIPGPLMFKIVVIKLTAPRIELIPLK